MVEREGVRLLLETDRRLAMKRVRCEVVEGAVPAQRFALVSRFDGIVEEVPVSPALLSGNRALEVGEIGREGERVLVELPVESSSGNWRIWVPVASVE